MKQLILGKNILETNEEIARRNRNMLNEKQIFTINMLGSPGAGKTTILENIIQGITKEFKMGVIEGDLYTSKDGERISKHNVDVVQLNTEGESHLNAIMIDKALGEMDLDGLDFLVIENVGNLVSTAKHDLSEDIKVVVMSVTEGNDKPMKYQMIFKEASIVILNKIDMLSYTDFNMNDFYNDLYSINNNIKVFEISCRENYGLKEVSDYLIWKIRDKKVR